MRHRRKAIACRRRSPLRMLGLLIDCQRRAIIDRETRALIQATERFHARLKRLDNGWREREANVPSAIAALRERLGERVRG